MVPDLDSAAAIANIVTAVPVIYQGIAALRNRIKAQPVPDATLVAELDNLQAKFSEILTMIQQVQVADLHRVEQIKGMRVEIEQLKQQLETKGKIVTHFDAAWEVQPDGSYDGPYYPEAWVREKLLLPMDYHDFSEATDRIEFALHYKEIWRNVSVPLAFLKKNNWRQLQNLDEHLKARAIILGERE